MKTSINSVHATKGTLLIKTLFACLVLAAYSFATIPTWAGAAEDYPPEAFHTWEPLERPRPEVLVKTDNTSAALVSGTTPEAQDPDRPIDMDGIVNAEQLRGYSNRRLMDTLRDLRKRKLDDYAGKCGDQGYFKEKIRLIKAALPKNLYQQKEIDISEDCPPPSTASLETKSGNGLQTVTFATLEGRVIVHLPDDIRAGDTISGTVFTEPKGDTPEEKAKNQNVLNSTVLDLAGTKIQAERPMFTWTPVIPQPTQPVRYQLKIVEILGRPTPSAMTQSVADINLDPKTTQPDAGMTTDSKTTPSFIIPPLGQQGRPIVITGPFDGNASNTTLRFGPMGSTPQDFEKNTENVSVGFGLIRPLAESPRKTVFESPTNVTGPVQLMLKEGDAKTLAPYRNVGLRLNAPKTNLLKGEQTVLTVEVRGLEGITKPVSLQLDATGVITMEAGNAQKLRITPAEVNQNGIYTTTRAITGQQAGAFTVTATVLSDPKVMGETKDEFYATRPEPPLGNPQGPGASGIMLSPVPEAIAEALANALKNKERVEAELAELRAAAAAAQEAADRARQAAETAEKEARNAQAQADAAKKAKDDAVNAVNAASDAVDKAKAERDRANREDGADGRAAARTALENAMAALAAAQKALKDAQAALAAVNRQKAADEAAKRAKEKKTEADKAAAALGAAQAALAEKEKEYLKAQQEVAAAQAAKDKAEQEARARAAAQAAAEKAAQERLWAEDIERRRQAQKDIADRAVEIEYLLDNIQQLGLITYKPKTTVPDPLDHVFKGILRKLAGQTVSDFLQTVAGEVGGAPPIPGGVISALGELAKSIGSFFDPRTVRGQVEILDDLRDMTNPYAKPPRKYNEKEAFDKLKKMQDLMKELRDKLAKATAAAGK